MVTTCALLSVVIVASVPLAHTATAFFGRAAPEKSIGTYVPAAVFDNSQTLTLLQAARNVDPNISRGGGNVNVVDGVALVAEEGPFSGAVAVKTAPASPDQISWYMVREGDTLSQVAQLFDVSVNTIIWANELSSNTDIQPGRTLLILPISGVQHTVVAGDTLKSIAKAYGGGAEDLDALATEILEFNTIADESALTVGTVITIPGGLVPAPVEEQKKASYASAAAPSGAQSSGGFIHPLPGAVRTQGIHGYNGVDYGAPVGTPIRSAAAGTVIVSRVGGWNGGYGNYVVIDHPNGTQTLYAHNSKNAVWQGQSVVAGQVIGHVGNTGRSTGPHLHFEVRGAKNPF
jgi:murein DD-endopeptidase MepM/ murein hydrolase activator NlpD